MIFYYFNIFVYLFISVRLLVSFFFSLLPRADLVLYTRLSAAVVVLGKITCQLKTCLTVMSPVCILSQEEEARRDCDFLFPFVSLFPRLGCGAGTSRRTAARHAHLSHCSQEVCLLVQRTIPLPGRPLCATGPGEEVPTQPASVPRHRLCVTTVDQRFQCRL